MFFIMIYGGVNEDQLWPLLDNDGNVKIFYTSKEAKRTAENNTDCQAYGYKIFWF